MALRFVVTQRREGQALKHPGCRLDEEVDHDRDGDVGVTEGFAEPPEACEGDAFEQEQGVSSGVWNRFQ